ncbi:MAG: hypothetical protein QXI49_07205 [Candidatus Methanomethylicaceae archaeon]
MTHTHHRRGTLDSLKEDYVVLIMSSKTRYKEYEDLKLKFEKAMKILAKYNPINLGNMNIGNIYWKDEISILSTFSEGSNIIHGVYTNREDVEKVLLELKEADLGFSVVVTGVMDEVFKAAKNVGLTPHTVNLSLGIFGKIEKLPKEEILWITSMCGHCMVSPSLVLKMINDIKKGKTTPANAARELAKCCVCGIFNVKRAEKLLRQLSKT